MDLRSIPFPARPVAVRAPGTGLRPQLSIVLWGLAIGVGLVMTVLSPLSDLVDDIAIRDTARPVPGALERWHCRGVVVSSCTYDLVAREPGAAEVRRTLNCLWLGSGRESRATIMADPARPDRITADFALGRLSNRIATMLIAGPAILAVGAWMLLLLSRSLRSKRRLARMLSGKQLRPGLLRLERWERGHWTVAPHPPRARGERVEWEVAGFPIAIDPGASLVLAVTSGDGSESIPLDSKLSYIDLTPEERRRLIDWIGPERLAWRPPDADRLSGRRRLAPTILVLGLAAVVVTVLILVVFG